jgi:hypothetical protein
MANFTVNFQANTTGEHRVYYRKYNDDPTLNPSPPTYTDYVSVVVSVPGPQAVVIEPAGEIEGNLYCGDIEYQGYIVAEYQFSDPDTNNNGIPDSAEVAGAVFTVLLGQQTDPCILYDITCDNVPVQDVTVDVKGSGYTSAPTVSITGGGGAGATATATLGDGIITSLDSFTAGTGYGAGNASSVQTVPLIRAGQVATTGSLATIDVTFDGGAVITDITLNVAGSGYTTIDNAAPMTIDNSALLDTSVPTTEATVDVSCSGSFADEVHDVSLGAGGSGYTSVPSVGFAGGGGAGAAATAVLDDCPALDLDTYVCTTTGDGTAGTNTNEVYTFKLGDSVAIGIDTASLPLPSEFTAVERATPDEAPCHCRGCAQYQITNSTGSTKKITFQTCWDGFDEPSLSKLTTVSYEMADAEVLTTECMIKGTLVLEDPTNGGWSAAVLNDPCV